MTELEIDMNMRIGEWSIIQESGKKLVPCFGPGYTGLRNLDNSCYLNSVMQVMFSLPEFKQRSVDKVTPLKHSVLCLFMYVSRYFENVESNFTSAPSNPTSDLDCQL